MIAKARKSILETPLAVGNTAKGVLSFVAHRHFTNAIPYPRDYSETALTA